MSSENEVPNAVPQAVLEAIPQLVRVLTPLSPDDRRRAISATMVLFGQPAPVQHGSLKASVHEEQIDSVEGVSAKASSWMKKYGIAREQLDHVFSIEADSVDVIAARMPATGKRQQTVQAYVICGLKSLLKTGEPAFSDTEARELCSKVGCYDVANHSNYRKAFGNFLSGTKDSGWKLTNPGLNEAAKIVKQLLPAEATA
jgi:hypothetical protein